MLQTSLTPCWPSTRVGEDDGRHRRVLDVDVVGVAQRRVAAADLDGWPHEPLELVDGVDGLVHQDAPALVGPGAAPRRRVKVRLRAPDADGALTKRQLAELAVVDGPPQSLRRRPEPPLEDDAEADVGPGGGVDHPVGLAEVDGNRFFAEDVDARLRRGDDQRPVARVRRADDDRVHLAAAEELPGVVENALDPMLGGQRARFLLVDVATSDEARAFCLREPFGMHLRDLAAADQADSNGAGHGV